MESLLYIKRPLFVRLGGLKYNRQAFQCLKQKVNICFTSRRDRMKTGKYFSAILALPGCLDCVAQITATEVAAYYQKVSTRLNS